MRTFGSTSLYLGLRGNEPQRIDKRPSLEASGSLSPEWAPGTPSRGVQDLEAQRTVNTENQNKTRSSSLSAVGKLIEICRTDEDHTTLSVLDTFGVWKRVLSILGIAGATPHTNYWPTTEYITDLL